MFDQLTHYTDVLAIVGDILTIRAEGVGFGDLAVVENWDGSTSLAQVNELQDDRVSLQVFTGGKGLSTQARVRFLGHPFQVPYSANILGRIFNGAGETIDGGPELFDDPRINVGGPSVNPVTREAPRIGPSSDRMPSPPTQFCHRRS